VQFILLLPNKETINSKTRAISPVQMIKKRKIKSVIRRIIKKPVPIQRITIAEIIFYPGSSK